MGSPVRKEIFAKLIPLHDRWKELSAKIDEASRRQKVDVSDEMDALYMPGLIWSYPGTTMIASATVNISPSQGISFLKGLAQSLLHAGTLRGLPLPREAARAFDELRARSLEEQKLEQGATSSV